MINKNITHNANLYSLLITHLDGLKCRYSKLLPIRIDIHYDKYDEINSDYRTARQEIQLLLFKAMQLELDIVGYALVMEYDQSKHIHFHAVFYVNGQKRKKYYPIYQALEHYWKTLTNNGYLYDCQRGQYVIDGLRMLNHYDHEAYRALCYALSYFAKEEQKAPFRKCYSECLFLSDVPEPSRVGKPRKLGQCKF